MKFKVGDRVRVVNTLGHGAKVGMTGEIVEVNGNIYGVRLDEWFGDGHDMYGKCEQGHGQWMTGENLELVGDNHKIVITSDGKTTLARLYEGKKVIKSAEAKCSPDDEFDFTKGAKIAFERLSNSSKKIVKGERYKIIGNSGNGGKGLRHNFQIGDVVICKAVDDRSSLYLDTGFVKEQWVSDEDVEPVIEPKYYSGKLVCVKDGGFPDYFTVGKVYKIVDGVLNPNKGIVNITFKNYKSLEDINENCAAKFVEIKE